MMKIKSLVNYTQMNKRRVLAFAIAKLLFQLFHNLKEFLHFAVSVPFQCWSAEFVSVRRSLKVLRCPGVHVNSS